ncbi:uncharacterized protein LACBIDRAFT_329145 [Laccaria bicolor S238N-H82]|uniref:Predicted protein n=1 Tax=Laccaria bicolor (strain S238N-H82 / ATCC MYA-4686) TaxID=486041 RepID=B0DH75_LACBS|nr:uncharacterized protein LACBIDRAFT_329145 [Laccaria bicolor S238N-H82]EDR05966.1 predicted protein [Laccaria bicolor S238N-H82]|eukprot:XP_001883254.1 predicted protein [Laccaria bicolor S238N-H82]
MSDLGCAVDTTGKLLDTSEIVFYNDPDDETPISGPGAPPKPSSIHPFFSHSAPPSRIIAGAHCSTRTLRPSTRLVDPDNAESNASVKRKANSSIDGHRVSQKTENSKSANEPGDNDSDDSFDDNDLPPLVAVEDFDEDEDKDEGDDVDVGTEPGDEAEYRETLAMTLADQEAAMPRTKQDCTADVCTIFQKDNEHKNVDMGAMEKGNWCKVCRLKGVQRKACFFTGGITTLRTHIGQHPDHIAIYKECCDKLSIPMHNHVFFQTPKEGPKDGRRSTEVGVHEEQLAFTSIEGNHSGLNITNILFQTVERYKISDKIRWFTANNTSNNDTAIHELNRLLNADGDDGWDPAQRHVHTVALTAAHCLVDKMTQCEPVNSEDEEDNKDDNVDDPKVSPSMHLPLQNAVDQFVLLADDSKSVLDLQGKSYSDFCLSKRDWKNIKLVHEILWEPANAQQSFSSTKIPTVFRTILILKFLQQSWENMSKVTKFAEMESALDKGLENLRKWYHKLAYTEDKWDMDFFNAGVQRLKELFNSYYVTPSPPKTNLDAEDVPGPTNGTYGYS